MTHEDEYIKERIEELRAAQQEALQHGRVLVSSYEQFWLPCLNTLPDVDYLDDHYTAPYGTFNAALRERPFTERSGSLRSRAPELPHSLQNQREWSAGVGVVDLNARTVKIQSDEVEVTFTSINISQSAAELLREINRELVQINAGVYLYRIEPVPNTVQHLYPDGPHSHPEQFTHPQSSPATPS